MESKNINFDVMDIPNGTIGNWTVETFEVPEHSIENIRLAFKPGCRTVKPGIYKQLTRSGTLIMSNTPSEKSDYRHFIRKATGNVLVNGLGLGCVLADLLNKTEIIKVTVIEISSDVISLIGPYFNKNSRVEIVCADAFKWNPPKGKRFNAVWHDIWDNICTDNLPEMTRLHRKYGRKTDWQDSWCKQLCKMYKERDKRAQQRWY